MSGLESIPPVIAAVELGIKIISLIINKVEKQDRLKKDARHLYDYSLSINQDRLKTDKNLAARVIQDPQVHLKEKENLEKIFGRVNQTLQDIEDNMALYEENSKENVITLSPKSPRSLRAQALANLENRSRELEKDLNVFHDKLVSLSLVFPPTTECLLSPHDFVLTGSSQPSSCEPLWLTATAFIATGHLAKRMGDIEPSKQDYLLEYKSYKAQNKEKVRVDMVLLNRQLVAAEATEGIPKVLGFRDEPAADGSGEFHLVMGIPNISRDIQTLQQCLRSTQPGPSLNERILLCGNLAEAVLHSHRLGLVHKNIRPENILPVPDPNRTKSSPISGKTYLIGWPSARRTENHQTQHVGEYSWYKRIYQHPYRQGRDADSEYCMGHDVYSLGVCMLEVLCWKPLVQGDPSSRTIGDEFKDAFFTLEVDMGEVNESHLENEAEWITYDSDTVKEVLMVMIRKHLPRIAGERITSTVMKCLTCLDGETDEDVEANVKAQQCQDPKEVGTDFVDEILQDIRAVASAI
ncbi:hypothetical protein O1611_g5541 [Lasiodiplodia mahajangana]|uniref:Uncharacterized protein n=1 Tax=Lasiodiplodia mahajangana TaxID=1108764 RepID=A0ACC2JLH6_9PEZI|nr:hypothetical protein O1611_g5541 [Lasiodiplodia mahajangana]